MDSASAQPEPAATRPARKRPWFKSPGCLTALAVMLAIPVGLVSFVAWLWHYYPAHRHCSKGTALTLRLFADDNQGLLPSHTNGFGDALLLLMKSNYVVSVDELTAPGDDGSYYTEALRTGGNVPEDRCSRMYIQGLSETNYGFVVMFDRYPTPGGDHSRRPWGPLMRDVIFADGSVQFMNEDKWSEFSRKQVELLVALGFSREQAEGFYQPFPGPVPEGK